MGEGVWSTRGARTASTQLLRNPCRATGHLLSPEVDCGQLFSSLSASDPLGPGLQLAGQGVAKDIGNPVSCPEASIQESLPVFPHSWRLVPQQQGLRLPREEGSQEWPAERLHPEPHPPSP